MLLSSITPKIDLSQIQKHLKELRHFQERDTLNDNHSNYLLKMNLMSNDVVHPKNPITFIFNVEVSPHACSFYHGFVNQLSQ
jgi:hypothetical protein